MRRQTAEGPAATAHEARFSLAPAPTGVPRGPQALGSGLPTARMPGGLSDTEPRAARDRGVFQLHVNTSGVASWANPGSCREAGNKSRGEASSARVA